MNKKPLEKVRKVRIESYITRAEHEKIVALAQQCGISISELLRRLALGQEINSKVDKEAFLNLLKVNADLGRLGGLFKLALTENARKVTSHREVRRILHEIEDRQEELRQLIRLTEQAVFNRSSKGSAS